MKSIGELLNAGRRASCNLSAFGIVPILAAVPHFRGLGRNVFSSVPIPQIFDSGLSRALQQFRSHAVTTYNTPVAPVPGKAVSAPIHAPEIPEIACTAATLATLPNPTSVLPIVTSTDRSEEH